MPLMLCIAHVGTVSRELIPGVLNFSRLDKQAAALCRRTGPCRRLLICFETARMDDNPGHEFVSGRQ